MNWYYVSNGQQAGPVEDAQLAELVRNGSIQFDTLVWREGMANWQPYGQVQAAQAAPVTGTTPLVSGLAPQEAVCAECGRIFNKQEMIAYSGTYVCAVCKPVFVQKLAEGAKLNSGALNYAGFWIRVGAKLLDGLIMGVVLIPVILFIAFSSAAGGASGRQPQEALLLIQLTAQLGMIVLSGVYSIFFVGKYGATPGKMACGLRVVSADGSRFGFGRATGRFFAEMLSGMICYIGYIIVGFDQEKRALHDHICNTRVIYK